jgi:hypothetical protein
MITFEPVNSVTGFKYAITNNGGMKTSGLEIAINARVINKELKWDVGLMIMTANNKLSKLPGNSMITEIGGASILSEVGRPANLFYGYKTNGILLSDAEATSAGLSYRNSNGTLTPFQAGDVRFVDRDGNYIIDENDMQVIGNPNPDFTGSISNVVSWKRFSFDALITFSKGNDIFNYTRSLLESMTGPYNQTPDAINRWKSNDQVTSVPRAAWGDPSGNARFSDRWIEDGSYLRLRTISLTYDIPIKPGTIIKYARIYATGNNLITLTRYLGFDPEFSASTSIFSRGIDTGLEPQFKSLQLGVRIGF